MLRKITSNIHSCRGRAKAILLKGRALPIAPLYDQLVLRNAKKALEAFLLNNNADF